MWWLRFMPLPLGLVVGLLPLEVAAGVATEAYLTGKAQIQYPSNDHPSCGVYIKGVRKDFADEDTVRVFDVSVMVLSTTGLVKAGVMEATTESIVNNRAPSQAIKPESFWVRAVGGGKGKTNIVVGPLQAESEGYLMYGTSIFSAIEFLDAVMFGRTVQIAYRLPGDSIETLNYGSVEFESVQGQQLAECLGDLAKSMEDDLAAEDSKDPKVFPGR